jgi:hypothetical protein
VQKSEKKSFALLELEMANVERFWRKTPLGPLGVNSLNNKKIQNFTVLKLLLCRLILTAFNQKNCLTQTTISIWLI